MTNNLDLKKKDLFENKPVLQSILSLAIPSIIGQLILVIYNMTDTFFIGLLNEPENKTFFDFLSHPSLSLASVLSI